MDLLEQVEQGVVDYVKLSSQEYLMIRDRLIAIAKRDQPKKVPNYLGFEQLFGPIRITIESEHFTCDFEVAVQDDNKGI